MTIFRNILLYVLGFKNYLKIISQIYITGISLGMWKKKYPELFYLDSLIKPGDTCIDIGANLGYYSFRMAKLVGPNGKVYGVEPIPLFGEIWKKNVKQKTFSQAKLLPYALGGKKEVVQMGIPEKNGRIHHGMTKLTGLANEEYVYRFNVEMMVPDELFKDLDTISFIKCDVEGYESIVFENFKNLISKFRPIVQSELNGQENRKKVFEIFDLYGYSCFILENNSLKQLSFPEAVTVSQDFYFLPGAKQSD